MRELLNVVLAAVLLWGTCSAQSGQGNSTGGPFAECRNVTETVLGLYDCLYTAFQCESDHDLLFDIFSLPSETGFVVDSAAVPCATPADLLSVGDHMLEVDVCISRGNQNCQGNRDRLTFEYPSFTIAPFSSRLFPFGEEQGDFLLSEVDDAASLVPNERGFPFFQRYYTAIHLSTNGLASFSQPYLAWYALPFPYGPSSIPVVAPFWGDIDFRNAIPSSGLYHQVFSRESGAVAGSGKTELLLQEFADRLQNYSMALPNFDPEWMLVATWHQATPYYGLFNNDETLTFQMVLATDYISSYVMFFYEDFNWAQNRRRRVVTGYDARDFRNYLTVELPDSSSAFSLDTITGNSGQPGAWLFNLTSNDELNSEGLCMQWSQRQDESLVAGLTGLSCPCTSQQALRDWSFWFAHRWGLSSRPNCATLLFSPLRSTIECCYDDDGSLLLGPLPGAGTYKLFNPLRMFARYTQEDSLPYNYCCQDSDRCSTYYQHRPYDDCSSYINPRPWFVWGDPHFTSVDDNQFTFNGIGEYLLLDSPENDVSLQARFTQFAAAVNGTVTSAVVLKQGSTRLQVQIASGELVLYIGQQQHTPPSVNSVLVVSETSVVTFSDSSPPPDSTLSEEGEIFVRSLQNGSVTITTPSSLALTVNPQTTFLSFAVELSNVSFTNLTSGLLGVLNGDPNDDFRSPSGNILNVTTDQELFDFGLLWHVEESESNFEYFAGESYEQFNNGYAEFTPTFIDLSQSTAEIQTACNGDTSCIYDAIVTDDMTVGISSMAVAMDNQQLETTLDNRPPVISGERVVYVTSGQPLEMQFNIADPDSDLTVFTSLREPVPIDITSSNINGNSATVVWANPDLELPSEKLRLVAMDSSGATSGFDVSVILCACMNGGECVRVQDTTSLSYNANGHFKQLCNCPQFFGGESCEIQQRGCAFADCPSYAQCVEDTSAAGYTCSSCSDGYTLNTTLNKCIDVDECAGVSPCNQGCNNTEGSFICSCNDGYVLEANGINCSVCDLVTGCECPVGFTGANCSIELNANAPEFTPAPPPLLETRWDLAAGATLLTITATDADDAGSNTVSYSVLPSPFQLRDGTSDGVTIFSISSEGVVSPVVDLIDHVANISQFVLMLAASDDGMPVRSSTVVVTVIPRPVPIIDDLLDIAINETTPSGSEVVMVTCNEIGVSNEPSRLALSLSSSGNESAMFRISNFSIFLTETLDFEQLSNPEFDLTFTCSNRYNNSASQTIAVRIINIDDNPFQFDQASYSAIILENSTRDEQLLVVTAFDADHPSAELTYSLSGTEAFGIVPQSGVVYVRQELDREVQDEYFLQVLAQLLVRPGELQNVTAELNITLLDVNDNAPRFEQALYIVNLTTRNTPGNLAVSVVAEDDDTGDNGNITYSLEPNPAFVIDKQTGEVFVNATLQPRTDFVLTAFATDRGDPSLNGSTTIDVYVFPAPDRVTFPSTVINFSVDEDESRGTLIGTVTASVLDVTNTTLNSSQVFYQFMENSTADEFTIDSASGEIFLLVSLDFEVQHTFDFIVVASILSDPLVQPGSIIVEIAVQNINDNAPVFMPAFYAQAIEELTPVGTSVLTVFTVDLDAINTTYSLTGADSQPFTLDPVTGLLSTAQELPVAQDYRFFVIAEDQGMPSLTSEAVVYISVTRSTSVTPAFDRESYIFDITENAIAGSFVGTVVALTEGNRTADEFPHLNYRIRMPDPFSNGSTFFHVNAESGNISTLSESAFDRESRNNFIFYVEVFSVDDNSTTLDDATVQVRILDANDNAPRFSQPLYTRVITSAQPLNSVILNVTATDEDIGSNSDITYFISSGGSNFSIDHTGAVFLTVFPIFPEEYRLTIEARDSGVPQQSGSALVFIAVIPATPTAVAFIQPVYTFQVREDTPPNGTLLGRVQAIDSTLNMTLSDVVYSTPNATDCFHIDPVEGEVRVVCSLDREQEPRFELEVVATAEGGVQGHAQVVVLVLDVNDNSPRFTLDVYTQVINDRHGNESAILEFPVEASDPDNGDNGTVSYSLLPSVDATLFRINASTGELFLIESTIALGDYRLSVQARDLGQPLQLTATALVLICVTRAGDPLVDFLAGQSFNISEDALPNTVVGTVLLATQTGLINPEEFLDNLQFAIVSGDSPEEFAIDPSSGNLTTRLPLDREVAATHVIVVDAQFPEFGIFVGNATFTISVLDVNDETPTFIPASYTAVTNNTADAGLVLSSVEAIDFDSGSNAEVSFSIEPGTPFGIRNTNTSYPFTYGELYVAFTPLMVGTFMISITATDSGSPPRNSSATVSIIVEHGFIAFNNDTYLFPFVEQTAINSEVGTVAVTPSLPNVTLVTFSITGGDGGAHFTIDPFSGLIRNALVIDREMNTGFNLTVQALSSGLEPVYSTVLVPIRDINDNPPLFSRSIYTAEFRVDEVSAGDILVTVTATDADEGFNSDITFSLAPMNNISFGAFRINSSTGDISSTQELEAEAYNLLVTAVDNGSPSLNNSAVVTITIRPSFPTTVSFTQASYTFPVSEYTRSGELVGSVEIEPLADNVVPFVQFMTVSDGVTVGPSPEPSCTIFNATSPRVFGCLTALSDYDFETVTSYTFNVFVSVDGTTFNAASLSSSTEVRVEVLDENDNTPVFVDFPSSRVRQDEEQPSDILVFDINATDADSGENARLTYEIVNTDLVGRFYINSSTGMLFAVAGLDREETPEYLITIRVSDNGSPTANFAQSQLEYRLANLNDNTPVITSGFNYSVAERLPPGSFAFTLEADDADENNPNIRYTIRSHEDIFAFPVRFAARINTVNTLVSLDFENVSTYNVSVELRDNLAPFRFPIYNITVHVLNEPDNTPIFSSTTYNMNVAPTVTDQQTFASVSATDADGDIIRYSITSIVEFGNAGTTPGLEIEELTGRIHSLGDQTLVPEANFTIIVHAYDFSRFNLSAMATVIVSVLPMPLQFTQQEYSVDFIENSTVGSEVIRIPISPLSISSDITFSIAVTSPSSSADTFSSDGQGGEVTILLAAPIDRENIDSYTIEVTASRASSSEETTVTLNVAVTDANDNRPVFLDAPNSVLSVNENVPSRTRISKANATDADIGRNGEIFYRFDSPPADLPFTIFQTTGVIETVGIIDYEEQPSYTFTVLARDRGPEGFLSATNTYRVNIGNLNDNFPQLAGNAYFGEVFSMAATNDFVRHILLNASDADDRDGRNPLSFNIVFPVNSPQFGQDYLFEVTEEPPYAILVKRLAEDADQQPQLLELDIELSDGELTSEYPVYISVFTQRNMVRFVLTGVTAEELLSCADARTSICELRRVLGQVFRREIGSLDPITFYNESVETSATNREEVTVTLYGWFGELGVREQGGELSISSPPLPVQYLDFSDEPESLFVAVAASPDLNFFDFNVEPDIPSLPTDDVVDDAGLDLPVIVGIAAGGVVGVLALVLIIVLVIVFGRRRKDKPKPKKKRRPSDPYERGFNQLQPRPRKKEGAEDLIGNGGSDLAYETMYDDDELTGTQTMPWFDPKYLAHDNDEYHADSEQTAPRPGGGGMRATVDGDARRGRRRSSDDGSGSVTELDPSGYLKQYQHSTPMQPGQRMGEYEMFARPRDDDKPFRPSLSEYQWRQQQQQQKHAASRL